MEMIIKMSSSGRVDVSGEILTAKQKPQKSYEPSFGNPIQIIYIEIHPRNRLQ